MKKICPDCKEEKDTTLFYKFVHKERAGSPVQLSSYCKKCSSARALRRFSPAKYSLVKYGLCLEEWKRLHEEFPACGICGRLVKRMAIDHNHKTGQVRGRLCISCNAGLGGFRDDPELLQRAIQYLSKHFTYER